MRPFSLFDAAPTVGSEHKTRVPGLCLACLFIVCSSASHAPAQELLFDGTAFDSESGEVLLTAGEHHYAEVVADDWHLESELRVVFELTSAQGFTRTSEHRIEIN